MKFATINQNVRSIKWAKLLNKTILSKRVLYVIVNIFAFYLGSLQMKNESKCFCLDQDTIIFIWPLSHISALFVPPKIPKEPFALASSLISHPKTEAKTRLESRAISIFSLVLRFLRGQKCQIFLLPTWFLTFPYVFTIIHLITPSRCLKITEKVSFNIVSEASYVYILSGQKLIKNAKNGPFWRVFENVKLAVKQSYQTGHL